ncbi:MAG: metallophosphoesterase [Alphaproteobacteria bacterium]
MRNWFAKLGQGSNLPRAGGRPPRLPAGERVYAIGDVHGRLDLLEEMDALIARDRQTFATRGVVQRIYLGDYVDRGPDSRGVVEHLCRARRGAVPPICLMGNHDWWLSDYLEGGDAAPAWLGSGGDATLASYGVAELPAFDDRAAWTRLRTRLRRQVPAEHRRFFNSLERMVRRGDYLFAHAGIRPGLPLDQQETRDLLFIREPFLSAGDDLGVVVVHGHTVVEQPVVRGHRIGIDTGAYWTGRLTTLVLEDDTHRFLTTGA